ncbi:hypothetical protein IJD44_00470 [bacterium]|nr:hypothetical protein [bacterium]
MYTLNFTEIIEFKKVIKEKYGETIHIHDTCPNQYFSLEKANDKIKIFIEEYFKNKNRQVIFDDNGITFSIK